MCTQNKNRVLSVTATPVKNKDRVEYIVYTSKDITGQEELKERFFVNKYQLSALLENVPELIYMKAPDGKYITGTKYSKEFFGEGQYFYFLKRHQIRSLDVGYNNTHRFPMELSFYEFEIPDAEREYGLVPEVE